ncbi:MAG: hypothetical protein Kow0092_22630 [Deferrisomatales bacterium]
MQYTRNLLDEIGIGAERLRMVNLSSAQGARFAEVCREMTEAVQALGPSPLRAGPAATPAEGDDQAQAG